MSLLHKLYRSPIRGAVGMGLIWAVGLGLGVGGLMEAFVDPYGAVLDMWPQTLGIPGFLGGMIFYTVLRIAEGRHSYDELPLTRVGAWGAASGLLLFGLMMAIFPKLWQEAGLLIGLTILLSIIAAVVTAVLFRFAARKQPPASSESEA